MSNPPAVSQTAPPEAQIGAVGRISGVLFSPKATFPDIVRRPNWIPPLLLLTLIAMMFNIFLVQRVDWVAVTRQQIEQNPFFAQQIEQLPPERRQQAIEQNATQTKYVRYFRGALGTLLLALIGSLIYLGLFNLLAGAGLNYKTTRSIVTYAYLPMGIRELLSIPVLFLKEGDTINPENVLTSNLGGLLPADAPLWQQVLGGSVDLFAIWSIVLLAIGFSTANPRKISFGKALWIIIGLTIIIILFFTGLTAMFS